MGDLGKSLLRALHPPLHVGTDATKRWIVILSMLSGVYHSAPSEAYVSKSSERKLTHPACQSAA